MKGLFSCAGYEHIALAVGRKGGWELFLRAETSQRGVSVLARYSPFLPALHQHLFPGLGVAPQCPSLWVRGDPSSAREELQPEHLWQGVPQQNGHGIWLPRCWAAGRVAGGAGGVWSGGRGSLAGVVPCQRPGVPSRGAWAPITESIGDGVAVVPARAEPRERCERSSSRSSSWEGPRGRGMQRGQEMGCVGRL